MWDLPLLLTLGVNRDFGVGHGFEALSGDRIAGDLADAVCAILDSFEGTIQISDKLLLAGNHHVQLLTLHGVGTGVGHVEAIGRIVLRLLARVRKLALETVDVLDGRSAPR